MTAMAEEPRFAVSFDDVLSAANQIAGAAVRTSLLENRALSERVGRRVLLKFEGAQHAGSFKFRGAYNRLYRHGRSRAPKRPTRARPLM